MVQMHIPEQGDDLNLTKKLGQKANIIGLGLTLVMVE